MIRRQGVLTVWPTQKQMAEGTPDGGRGAMLRRRFLTELDSRAEVKGSVDPLGIQAVWTHFGRFVVGNLTTVGNSAVDRRLRLPREGQHEMRIC